MNIRCKFGFHKWNQWTVHESGKITANSFYNPGHKRVIGETIIQKRQCECCGKLQFDTSNIDYM